MSGRLNPPVPVPVPTDERPRTKLIRVRLDVEVSYASCPAARERLVNVLADLLDERRHSGTR